jgi:hypothetical protein
MPENAVEFRRLVTATSTADPLGVDAIRRDSRRTDSQSIGVLPRIAEREPLASVGVIRRPRPQRTQSDLDRPDDIDGAGDFDDGLQRVLRDWRTNALLAWLLAGILAVMPVESVLDVDRRWILFVAIQP